MNMVTLVEFQIFGLRHHIERLSVTKIGHVENDDISVDVSFDPSVVNNPTPVGFRNNKPAGYKMSGIQQSALVLCP
ncbi:hypothetical protein [Sulfitobacter sp. R18_1]|uniref:hypothetical protein n=1 Tax=Sulfitobacter sp. R18_1 TaxID=2821104 RepID=UPI001ADA463D|nr:hypothetical protein [Sulfitobacter sp. R18_1]MBO9427915.1 hypothetical protein [Sulfitobacter sp. R18_1]